jgi:hypothetical protein
MEERQAKKAQLNFDRASIQKYVIDIPTILKYAA